MENPNDTINKTNDVSEEYKQLKPSCIKYNDRNRKSSVRERKKNKNVQIFQIPEIYEIDDYNRKRTEDILISNIHDYEIYRLSQLSVVTRNEERSLLLLRSLFIIGIVFLYLN